MPGSLRRHFRIEVSAPRAAARPRPHLPWLPAAAACGWLLLFAAVARGAESDSLAGNVDEPAARATASATEPAGASEIPAGTSPATSSAPAPSASSLSARPSPPARPSAPVVPPAAVRDVNEWLDYKAQSQRPELAHEARLFHRLGLEANAARNPDEAARLVRGAMELDPSYAEPRWTLARWSLLRDPGQALAQLSLIRDQVQASFALQLGLVSNAIYVALFALSFALIGLGILIVIAHHGELRHPIVERLTRWVSRPAAVVWSWLLLALPWGLGLGMAFPTVLVLGLLWPNLRRMERAVWIALVAFLAGAPFLGREVGRLALPMSEDRAPFFGVLSARNDSDPARCEARFAELARRHPDRPFVQFGLAWAARNVGHPEVAEQAYRRALQLWPDNAQLMNNLGNVLMIEGRTDEAIQLYRKAVTAEPHNAAAHFNLSQAYTKSFDFRHATEELSTASQLDFELIRTHKGRTTADGFLPLADQWLTPRVFWDALRAERPAFAGAAMLPPAWHDHPLAAGPGFCFAIVLVAGLGLAAGLYRHRRMPLRHCANCARVLCRRCSAHRRTIPLCIDCARADAAAKSGEFSRVLLQQQRRRLHRVPAMVLTAASTVVPGLGLVFTRGVLTPFAILLGVGALWSCAGTAAPYAFEPRLTFPDHGFAPLLAVIPWVLLQAWSIVGYLRQRRRIDQRLDAAIQPLRVRPVPAPRRPTSLAA